MARESLELKAARYLVEGRLQVILVDNALIVAKCRGAGQVYRCGYNTLNGWFCSCPAKGRCAHLVALQNVTVQPPEPGFRAVENTSANAGVWTDVSVGAA